MMMITAIALYTTVIIMFIARILLVRDSIHTIILGIPTRPTDGQLLPKRPALVVHIVATRATEFFGAKAQIEGGLAVGLPPGCAC